MSKSKKLACVVLGIAFILFHVIAFAIPVVKAPTFWIAYAFTTVAFLLQILIWKVAFHHADTLKSKFLGIPVIHIGIVYLIIQLVIFAVLAVVPMVPAWVAVIVCALILCITAIFLVAAEVGKDEVARIDEKVQRKVAYLAQLQADVELLATSQTDGTIKQALEKLAEKLKFSDPMSADSLASLEEEIQVKVATLSTSDGIAIIPLVKEIELLLVERNKKCKLLK